VSYARWINYSLSPCVANPCGVSAKIILKIRWHFEVKGDLGEHKVGTLRCSCNKLSNIYDSQLCMLKANGKAAQWVPVSTNSFQLRTDVATQTVGLFYPSQRQMSQKNDEIEQKLNAVKEMYERRPVVLTAVSPGKGQLFDVTFW